MGTPEAYLRTLENAINRRDGPTASRLLRFSDSHVSNWNLAIESPEYLVKRHISSVWDEMIAAHIRCIWCINKQNIDEAYACQTLLVHRSSMDESKKWGMMGLCNQLFKIYFQINKLPLCKPIIRAIDNMQIKDKFSLAQRVTYNYYAGRKAMFEDNYKAANDCLEFAFYHCHRSHVGNKRLILIYLIPVKMLLGIFPKKFILQKYRLLQFVGIVEAVRGGNLTGLNRELETNEAFFIKCGIYLILEKLKTITYRNLFKKVYLILGTHQLPIGAFTAALNMMEEEVIDKDETECILANLIHQNKIKGYLAHQQQMLVVSKQQAFPPLLSDAIVGVR